MMMGVHQRSASDVWFGETDTEPEVQASVAEYFSELYGDEPTSPCPRHPKAESWLCRCRPGNLGVRREFMTQDERREVFEKTGVPVESTSDMRRAFREKGLREAESGEHVTEVMEALKDHAETGGKLDPRYAGHTLDPFGVGSAPEFNWRERYEYHKARLGEK